MLVREMKGLKLGEGSLHLLLHHGVGMIGGCEFGFMLGGGGCAFVLVNLEAHHHLVYNGVALVESQFVNRSAGFPEFKASFLEVVLEVISCFVLRIGAFTRLNVIFED